MLIGTGSRGVVEQLYIYYTSVFDQGTRSAERPIVGSILLGICDSFWRVLSPRWGTRRPETLTFKTKKDRSNDVFRYTEL